jgi:hypothetical protein
MKRHSGRADRKLGKHNPCDRKDRKENNALKRRHARSLGKEGRKKGLLEGRQE